MRLTTRDFTTAIATAFAFAAMALVPSDLLATPIYDTFGPLAATFGGTGIPSEEVAVSSTIVDGNVTFTVAMSATARYSNPTVTNDGAGTYYATPGSNFGGAGESATEGALWNFNFYIDVEGSGGAAPILADYQFDLYYDFNTGADTPIASLGYLNLTNAILAGSPTATTVEDSQNLMFSFFSTALPGFVTPPAGAFDPSAVGEYNFALQVSNTNGFSVEAVAIDVRVAEAVTVPEPSTLLLLAGLVTLACAKRRVS